jgi:hypothetical protein
MKEFNYFTYPLEYQPTSGERNKVKELLNELPGIEEIYFESNYIKIKHAVFKIAKDYIEEVLEANGFRKFRPKKESVFKRFINKLIKTNKDEFGDKKLDCCDLNE